MVTTETSEWNDVFLYTVTRAKANIRAAQHMAATIQAHEERVQRFIEGLPKELQPPKDLSGLPKIWEHQVLIVADDATLVELLARLLGKEMMVETAGDGQEGLTKAKDRLFDLVLSDIEMPIVDGLGFYRQLVEVNPDMKGRFLFWTGRMNPEKEAFLKANDLEWLPKPLELGELARKIHERVLGTFTDM